MARESWEQEVTPKTIITPQKIEVPPDDIRKISKKISEMQLDKLLLEEQKHPSYLHVSPTIMKTNSPDPKIQKFNTSNSWSDSKGKQEKPIIRGSLFPKIPKNLQSSTNVSTNSTFSSPQPPRISLVPCEKEKIPEKIEEPINIIPIKKIKPDKIILQEYMRTPPLLSFTTQKEMKDILEYSPLCLQQEINASAFAITVAQFSPDFGFFATAGEDHIVRIFELNDFHSQCIFFT